MSRPAGRGAYALPIVVSAGLAVGVFGGLLIINGPGNKAEANSAPVVVASPTSTATPDPAATPDPPDKPVAVAADTKPADDKVVENGADEPPKEFPKAITLKFKIDPSDSDATIEVNGDKVDGSMYTTTIEEPTTIKVVAKADGFRKFSKELEVRGDETIKVKMRKPRVASSSKPSKPRKPRKPRRPRKPRKPSGGPGGLIDL